MLTIELTIYVDDLAQELLIAELADLDFDAFTREDAAVHAYIAASRFDDTRRQHVEQWLLGRGYTRPVEERLCEEQNWNAQWEETIRPLAVGPFLIKPTWADLPPEHADRILLEIDPKMSFGTGYHASTRLALRALHGLVSGGEYVLDVGAGTGILSVAALKLGAASAVACDTDPWAQQNAVENFYLNGVAERADFRPGSLEVVSETGFDLVLANINRNTLLEMMPHFARKTTAGGNVVLSGILTDDRPRMEEAARDAGFTLMDEVTEGEWLSMTLQR